MSNPEPRSSSTPPSTELPGEIEGAIRVLRHAVGGSNCLPGNREAEAFALTNLRSIIAKHLSATPSSPETRGTIKATAVPGTLPDTAPFVWDDPPAELTEALRAYRSAVIDADHCYGEGNESEVLSAEAGAEAELLALYNGQREEIEEAQRRLRESDKLTALLLRDTGTAEDQIASLSSQLERLEWEATKYRSAVNDSTAAEFSRVRSELEIATRRTEVLEAHKESWKQRALAAESSLERLKALAEFVEGNYSRQVFTRSEIVDALRLRSLSDQKND